jgi:hypothetical protein
VAAADAFADPRLTELKTAKGIEDENDYIYSIKLLLTAITWTRSPTIRFFLSDVTSGGVKYAGAVAMAIHQGILISYRVRHTHDWSFRPWLVIYAFGR